MFTRTFTIDTTESDFIRTESSNVRNVEVKLTSTIPFWLSFRFHDITHSTLRSKPGINNKSWIQCFSPA
jgi:hypothetical protein